MTSRGSSSQARVARLETSTQRGPKLDTRWTQSMPNIIDYAMNFLGISLYPRQATLLKLMFCAGDLLTDYDDRVIAEWAAGFSLETRADGNAEYVGNYGVCPDVGARMKKLRGEGRAWFREGRGRC